MEGFIQVRMKKDNLMIFFWYLCIWR